MSTHPSRVVLTANTDAARKAFWSLTHVRGVCRHDRFSIDAGDRAKKTFAEAVDLANHRAERRGIRQRVTRHVGPFFPVGVYYIQDVR